MSLNLPGRRGATLVELLVAVVLLLVVVGLISQILTQAPRVARGQSERHGLHSELRVAAQLVGTELGNVAVHRGISSDLLVTGSSDVSYRATRATGLVCQITPSDVVVTADSAFWFALRVPAPGRDSILVFVEGDSTIAADDRWVALPLLGPPTTTMCPSGGAALNLPTVVDTVAVPLAALSLPAPLRTFEVMRLALYSSSGQYWLGVHSLSAHEVIQPVLGPLLSNGFELGYLDSLGTTAMRPNDVAAVRIIFRGITDRTSGAGFGSSPSPVSDSISRVVFLKNSR